MGVETPHRAYLANVEYWERCRDCAAGQDAIHARGEAYLPRLGGQTDAKYQDYLSRTPYYGAMGRTVDALAGLVMRLPVQWECPDEVKDLLKDIDGNGMSADELVDLALREDLTVSWGGIFVDYSRTPGGPLTIAQAEALKLRPIWTFYRAEDILNWRFAKVDGVVQLVQVRLREVVEVPKGEFDSDEVKQVRVIDLDESGHCRVRVFVGGELTEDPEQTVYIMQNGQHMRFVPFVFLDEDGRPVQPDMPALLDLANASLSHYRTNADLEHAAHLCGVPTPVITGWRVDHEDDGEIALGAEALIFPSADTKAFFLSYGGEGLASLEKRREVKEENMAALGARMLTPEKKAAEAAETVSLRTSGEHSALANRAAMLSRAFTKALKITVDWVRPGYNGEVWARLNTRFGTSAMSPAAITSLVALWQSGGVAHSDLHRVLTTNEVISPDRDYDEMKAEIEAEQEALPPMTMRTAPPRTAPQG